jgi:pimeloyl-ACP methyl ester carboxylesterase
MTAQTATAAVPTLTWRPCASASEAGFQCATVRGVPLDYGDPSGATIELAAIRHRATGPAHRLGSLLFNPGGPGDAGTQDLPTWYGLFPAELRARFDIVSWDPRGIGDSTAVQCFPTMDAEGQFLANAPIGFPVGAAETSAWIRTFAGFGRRCGKRNGNLLAHVSTADSARDLDLLRRVVRSPRLNYLGVSYGTLLGATYANLFPRRIRAMTLDGNVDPVAWSRRGTEESTSLRLGGGPGLGPDPARVPRPLRAGLHERLRVLGGQRRGHGGEVRRAPGPPATDPAAD